MFSGACPSAASAGMQAYSSIGGGPHSRMTVSGAAGAVGSVACQIAKIRGSRVVGSAGSAAKTEWLTSVAGVDDAIDYRTVGNLRSALAERFPDGIDVYFDNVGGDHLEAAAVSPKMAGTTRAMTTTKACTKRRSKSWRRRR